jgi:hypothetical protein
MGIAFALYGFWQISMTVSFVKTSVGRATGRFVGYHRTYHESTSFQSSPASSGTIQSQSTWSVASCPEFSLVESDGRVRTIRESKVHVWERFEPGQTVEILLDRADNHRLAGFYSLYVRDLFITLLGLGFVIVPLLLWFGLLPALATPSGTQVVSRFEQLYAEISATRVGPITVAWMVKAIGAFMVVAVLTILTAAALPYIQQMGWGSGNKLITALEDKRFDEARGLILEKKGISATNRFNQNALLVALEAGQNELARLLIEAGAEVNIKSKMYKTPLGIAAQSGDLAVVKLLVARKAELDTPEDEVPPVIQAMAKGHLEIVRFLIANGSNLQRQYRFSDGAYTVGDLAVLGKKADLVELIRQKGGRFTR